MSETSQFLAVQQSGHLIKRPIPTLWANDRPAMLRGFALIAAGSLAFHTFFVFMPNHLAATRKLDLVATLSITAATLAVTAAAAWVLGRLSDAVGRRPVAIWSALGLAVLAGPMAVLASASQLGLLIGQLIMGAVLAGVLLVAMVGELFQLRFGRRGCRSPEAWQPLSSAEQRRSSIRSSSLSPGSMSHPACT